MLLRHADGVADRLAAAEQDLAALAGLVTGSVRVTAFPTAGAVLLPPTLLDLRRRAPGLLVRFDEREPPEAEAAVRDGEADVAVVFRHDGERDPVPGDLLRDSLVRDEVLLVLPADAPTPADLAALSGSPWIAGCARCSAHLVRSARQAGFTPDVRFTTDDHVVVQRLVAAGFGAALLPGWALRASPQEGLRTIALLGLASRAVELLVRPDAARVPAVAALVGALRTAAGELETAEPTVVRWSGAAPGALS